MDNKVAYRQLFIALITNVTILTNYPLFHFKKQVAITVNFGVDSLPKFWFLFISSENLMPYLYNITKTDIFVLMASHHNL